MDQPELPILLVGSANAHKIEEIRAILEGAPLEVRGSGSLPGRVEVEESGETFEENARLKALAFACAAARIEGRGRPRWVVSDDSGLCVDALDGAPGVLSARYAGGGHRDEDNNRKLLGALRGIPSHQRTARFVCAAACVALPPQGEAPQGEPGITAEITSGITAEIIVARGECPGVIAEAPRGRGGFGYDPLFLIPELGKTYAELGEPEKNRLSHRGRAFRLLAQMLLRPGAAAQGQGARER